MARMGYLPRQKGDTRVTSDGTTYCLVETRGPASELPGDEGALLGTRWERVKGPTITTGKQRRQMRREIRQMNADLAKEQSRIRVNGNGSIAIIRSEAAASQQQTERKDAIA